MAEPDVDYRPLGNSFAYKSGDVVGIMSGTSGQTDASPAGTMRRLGAVVGGSAASFPIVLASGIWGVVWNDATADSSGNVVSQAAPTGVNPQVVPINAAGNSRSKLLSYAPAIAGVQRAELSIWLADQNNYFVQRHKKGTRVNISLVGKLAALTYNATTLEFEVDTTGSNPTVVVEDVPPMYGDNRTYYDSATFATDTVGGWVVFRFIPSVQAQPAGLSYAS